MTFLKKLIEIGTTCPFLALTGYYCPGCGGTRAVRSLLKGDLRMSIQYHPLVLYAVIVFLMEVVIRRICRNGKHPINHRKRERVLVLIGAAIVLANWIFKNYMLAFRGIDLLPIMK